jgi:hypothetical protein
MFTIHQHATGTSNGVWSIARACSIRRADVERNACNNEIRRVVMQFDPEKTRWRSKCRNASHIGPPELRVADGSISYPWSNLGQTTLDFGNESGDVQGAAISTKWRQVYIVDGVVQDLERNATQR